MKTIRKISAVLLVMSIVVTFFACNKEKEQSSFQQIVDEVNRRPIATFDNSTGKMTYHFTTEKLQQVLDHSAIVKENGRFIVESMEINSLNSKNNDDEGIMFSIIDTETEITYTTFLNSGFIEKIPFNDSLVYYIAEDVISGSFSFTDFRKNGAITFTLSNFEVVNVESIPDSLLFMAPRPKKTITCESQGCVSNGCHIYFDMYHNPEGCTECGATQNENVYCRKIESSGGGGGLGAGEIIGIIGIALTIIFGIVALCA